MNEVMQKLEQDLVATEPAVGPSLMVEKIDTSKWVINDILKDAPSMDSVPLGTVFMSCTSTNRAKAIQKLEEELERVLLLGMSDELMGQVWANPTLVSGIVRLQGVLAPPSTIALVRYPREGEQPDCTMTVDLRGEIPAVRNYAAFCFFRGYTDLGPLEYADLLKMTPLACREGMVGLDLDIVPEVVKDEAVKKVDTSSWTEFGDFFQKPETKSFIYEFNDQEDGHEIRRVLASSFVSVRASTKEKAVEALRADLVKLTLLPWVEVKAFLSKPATIELAPPLLGEQAGQPQYAAFCFLHGRQGQELLTKDLLQKLGLEHACYEAEVGKFVG